MLGGANSIEQQAGSTFGGEAYLGGSQALLAGTTRGSVEGGFAALEIRGTVGGDVTVDVGDRDTMLATAWSPGMGIATPAVQPGLTVADDATIGGTLHYTATLFGRDNGGDTMLPQSVANALIAVGAVRRQPFGTTPRSATRLGNPHTVQYRLKLCQLMA